AIQPRDGFGVVIEDFRPRVHHHADGFLVALKVRYENFHLAAGGLAADLLNHHDERARAAEDIVVAIDAGDDGKFETEGSHGFRHAARLIEIDRVRTAFGHRAE